VTGIGTSILAFVVAIGVLVAFHEFGHYWVARRLGVKVLRYSIGFGKPLYTWRGGRDQTEYCLSAIPLGGYVKMLDEREGNVAPEDRHRAFNVQPLWRRTAIVAAGPAFNFIFAIAVYWLIFVAGTTELRPVIGAVQEGTPAAEAGLERGDELLAVNGRATPTWDRVLITLLDGALSRDRVELSLRGEDGGEFSRSLDLSGLGRVGDNPDLLGAIGFRPWQPEIRARIGELIAGGSADEAGLLAGDEILTVDDRPVDDWSSLVAALGERAGSAVILEVDRGNRIERVDVQLGEQGSDRGILGIRPDVPAGAYDGMAHTVRYGPLEATGQAVVDTWRASVLTLNVLWKMIVGQASLNNLSGPITIGQFAGDTASSGLVPFLKFLAIVSISLGILNLLPIPVLDGGHLLYFAVEAIKGSPPSERAQILGQQVGIMMLFGLMGLAFYNDLARLLG
jgi:regulator of sigma E protease